MSSLLAEAALRVVQLEVPQEVVHVLEVLARGGNLVDDVLHADDTCLAQALLDDGVVTECHSLALDTSETSLVHELADGLPQLRTFS